MISRRRVLKFIPLVTLIAALDVDCHAQDKSPLIGRRVMITEAGTELKTPEGVVWRAYLGEVFTVSLVKDEWLWIHEKQGWLWVKHCVPFDEAIERYTAALRTNPSAEMFHGRGIAWLAHGEPDKAIDDFNESIRRSPRIAGAYVNRGNAWQKKNDVSRALADYHSAIQLDPKNFMAINNRGMIHTRQRKFDAALADLNKAIELNSEYAEAFNNRGVVWREKGEFEKAIADYTKALEIDANFVAALSNRAYAYKKQQQFGLALADYSKASVLDTRSYKALNDLAWMLATCPDKEYRDGAKAVENAKKACDLSKNRDWNTLDTMAAALAEAGHFDDAVKWSKLALRMAPKDEKASVCEHMAKFEQRQPVRESVVPRPESNG